VQLPLTKDDPKHQWHPDLVAYWQRFGDPIGVAAAPYPAPSAAVRMRRRLGAAGTSRSSIVPQDLNIIVQVLSRCPTRSGST
jgi:hypothetical protein